MEAIARPERSEAVGYYFTYIDQVGDGDIRRILETQGSEAARFLREIDEQTSLSRYAPGKWSIREVIGHVNDTERVFALRALYFARVMGAALPGFDQDTASRHAGADGRSLGDHVLELEAVRASTLTLFRGLGDDAWARRGEAGGREFSVRALAYIAAGHMQHHLRLIRERYL